MSQINQSSTGDQNQSIGNVSDSTVFRDVYGNIYYESDKRFTTESLEREKIILFVAVHPVDTMSLRLDEEVREIENALKRTKQGEQFKLEVLRPICLSDIRDALLEHDPQIVHFSGDGIKTEGFAIADDVGEIKLVTTDQLKKLFSNFPTIECVVLNISFSEQQSNAIVQHINYVIDLSLIGHKTAIEFTKAFYARRRAGRSIEDSYNYGCDSITSFQDIPKNLIPVIKKKTKLENLAAYRTEATRTIIRHYAKNYDQLSPQARNNLDISRIEQELLEEEASDIDRHIFQLLETFEVNIKHKIESYKNDIIDTNIDKFTGQIREDFSDYQKLIGLGDEIISINYVEVADDLLCQKDLSRAKVFLEEAAKLDNKNPLVYQSLALIYFEEQKYNKVLVELNRAKRLFEQKKMLEDVKKIDFFINQIPISSRIIHLIGTVLQMFVT